MDIRPLKTPTPDSKLAEDVLTQAEMIFQGVHTNTMQAYIKYKAYYDKKHNASKLKEGESMYILQPIANYQGGKIVFTGFWCIGSHFVEKALTINNCLVRKVGTS